MRNWSVYHSQSIRNIQYTTRNIIRTILHLPAYSYILYILFTFKDNVHKYLIFIYNFFTVKKIDRRPMSTETTRSAPDVIIVSKPIRWLWPPGPPPWAPTPPEWPLEPRLRPEGCQSHLDTRSINFDSCEGYYSQYFDQKVTYDYCLKSDFYKSQTLPRRWGSSDFRTSDFRSSDVRFSDVRSSDVRSSDYRCPEYKVPRRSVCFYGVEDECDRNTFVVKADIEAPR